MPASLQTGAARPALPDVQVYPYGPPHPTPAYLICKGGLLLGRTVSAKVAAELVKNNRGAVVFKRVMNVEDDE